MAKIDKATVKRALIAAEANKPSLAPERPSTHRARRETERLLASYYRASGLDMKRLAVLQKEHAAELDAIDRKEEAAALKKASRRKDTVHSSIASQSQALQQLTARNEIFPFPSFSLDKPILILATPNNGVLWDSHIESFNSWAKFYIDTTSTGVDRISFYFMWTNQSSFYSVINASTFLSATGHMRGKAYGGVGGLWDVTRGESAIGVSAEFALWSWWQNPATRGPPAYRLFDSVWATADFFDTSRSASISDAANLDRTLFLVPPHGVVIFQVCVTVAYENDHGRAIVDFKSGDYKIACPVVVVSQLSGASTLTNG